MEMEQQDAPAPRPVSLFGNDRGTLPFETRQALIMLQRGPSIDSKRHPNVWQVLLRDEATIVGRLHEHFLDLVIDREKGVACTRQLRIDGLDVPMLLRSETLTFIQSVLVIFLRMRLGEATSRDERAVVSVEEMKEHLAGFERKENVDRSQFDRQVQGAIEKAKKLNFLSRLERGGDRFEISPALAMIFGPEQVLELRRAYDDLIRGESQAVVPPAAEAAEYEDAEHE